MKHNGVSLILATGGPGMVRSAYSSGKPALGVGAGNVPCFIEKSADIKQAVNDLILSKTFDNGMICASEQGAIIEEGIYDEVVGLMKAYNCYFVNAKEKELLEKTVINSENKSVNPDEAVAMGAAIQANIDSFPKKMKVTDVSAHSLGILARKRKNKQGGDRDR